MKNPLWLEEPEQHDYPAALSYLRLLMADAEAGSLVLALEKAQMSEFKAKDIIRASGLPHLGSDNRHVAKNLNKISTGKSLSPVLLVRRDGKVIIADGYHRCCAVYLHDEDAVIPCKII